MKETSTVVVPIQFDSKKRWGKFQKQIFEQLRDGKKNEQLKWKKICYDKKKMPIYTWLLVYQKLNIQIFCDCRYQSGKF